MNMPFADSTAPDAEDIAALARAAIDELPPVFRDPARQVRLRVEDLAPDEMLDEMGLDDPFGLTGLYEGVPMTQKSATFPDTRPDTIWLFRRAILDDWAARGDVALADLVTNVMIHELAHHFGWSDEDIAKIDRWWE